MVTERRREREKRGDERKRSENGGVRERERELGEDEKKGVDEKEERRVG